MSGLNMMEPQLPDQSQTCKDFLIPIVIGGSAGVARHHVPVSVGVPFARSLLDDVDLLEVLDPAGRSVPHQAQVLARWSDDSIRWMLLDFQASTAANARETWFLRGNRSTLQKRDGDLVVSETSDAIIAKTGNIRFSFPKSGGSLVSGVRIDGVEHLSAPGIRPSLRNGSGGIYSARIDGIRVEDTGPVRVTLAVFGGFEGAGQKLPVEFLARLSVYAGSGLLTMDFGLRNPMAAAHPGNLWDLGDVGSFCFGDLTVEVHPQVKASGLRWLAEPEDKWEFHSHDDWTLYQDSSGGENWNSSNHVDATGVPTVTFRGYKVSSESEIPEARMGYRASPVVIAETDLGSLAVAVDKFWQNFPKALRWNGETLGIALFPAESGSLHELQGGERKRHVIRFALGAPAGAMKLLEFQQPVQVTIDPTWIEDSGAVPYFSSIVAEENQQYKAYLQTVIEGPDSFFNKREVIDEYGWRNFGEVYADHEAVNKVEGEPLVSHFNNQYDFLHASCIHFLRSGDYRWWQLMTDAARHIIDIDIYHTERDISAYNGGLFWHTDHYLDAKTSTHRTYSRANGTGQEYGGGPSNEHNYTTGLLQYFYLTGDPEAGEAVIKLAKWVLGMDDGTKSLMSFVDSRATGRASSTVNDDYHKPGRGAGNSINAVLDAFSLTADRQWLDKAEELITRCIHPSDEIAQLGLDEPEHRWSYLVFLQALGKYLEVKAELEEGDYSFFFARDSLLHYARWMLQHEVPYFDVLHKVELPTETWPAQDIRKCHVMHLAAICAMGEERKAYADKTKFFFERCLVDLLRFKTAHLSRPQVLLASYGHIHGYFLKHGYDNSRATLLTEKHNLDFGRPRQFRPQHPLARKLTWDALRRLVARRLQWAAKTTSRRRSPKSESLPGPEV